jgi:hypothetical protein
MQREAMGKMNRPSRTTRDDRAAQTEASAGQKSDRAAMVDLSARGSQLRAVSQLASHAAAARRTTLQSLFGPSLAQSSSAPMQMMTVRTGAKAATVSGETSRKHVMAASGQEAAAREGFGSRTFVSDGSLLTAKVDAHDHNFTEEARVASGRFDFDADVVITQWDKTEAPPGGLAKDKPVAKTIDGVSTSCEIGVTKGGDDALKVTHFKKN